MALMSGGFAGFDLLTSCTSNDGTASYSYDPTGQLVGATYTGDQANESYSYDANGNRTNAGYVTGADNRLLSDGVYRYEYDAEGNRIERYVDNDQDGALDAGDTDITAYSWDNRNRLIEVTDYDVFGGEPHNPAMFNVAAADFDFDPAAVCPRFDRWLDWFTCGNESLAKLVLEMLAYVLLLSLQFQRFFLLIGNGNNGKQVLLRLIGKLVSSQ